MQTHRKTFFVSPTGRMEHVRPTALRAKVRCARRVTAVERAFRRSAPHLTPRADPPGIVDLGQPRASMRPKACGGRGRGALPQQRKGTPGRTVSGGRSGRDPSGRHGRRGGDPSGRRGGDPSDCRGGDPSGRHGGDPNGRRGRRGGGPNGRHGRRARSRHRGRFHGRAWPEKPPKARRRRWRQWRRPPGSAPAMPSAAAKRETCIPCSFHGRYLMRLPGSDAFMFTPAIHRYVRLAIKGALCSEKSLKREPTRACRRHARVRVAPVHQGDLAPHDLAEFALPYPPPLCEDTSTTSSSPDSPRSTDPAHAGRHQRPRTIRAQAAVEYAEATL